jgi:hypothetical protein
MEDKLRLFIEKYSSISHPNLYEQSYEIRYTFNNFETTLIIVYNFDHREVFGILIPSMDDPEFPDLHISLYENSFHIEYIYTRHKSQYLPIHKKGTWIMHLIDQLALELQVDTLYLRDKSCVICDDEDISLMFLRIYNGGRSWYEKFGYKPIRIDYEEYEKLLEDYISTPMTIVMKDLQGVISNEDRLIIPIPILEEMLGEYMIRTSKISFEIYNKLEIYFSKLSFRKLGSEWVDKGAKILDYNRFSKLIKVSVIRSFDS